MIRTARFAPLLLLAVALPARAEPLPGGFNWDDDAVLRLASRHPEALDSATPDERARLAGILMKEDAPQEALTVLSRASDVDRFQAMRALDRGQATDVRTLYDGLDAKGRTQLLSLAQSAGTAGTAAGLQQVGIISDNDDTAFPTTYTPDGTTQFKGAADFYNLVGFGTDGKGDPANIHYVSARIPELFPDSRARLAAAGLPDGTFDGDNSIYRFAFGGLDGIQASKIENIDLWMKLHPGQRFVLMGDSLQRDPEVYRWALQNHPDQVELVMIHKAGGPVRAPSDYKGEVFFDDYPQAKDIVTNLGIPQPGAKLPDRAIDETSLPLPDTDVSAITAQEKKVGFFTKVKDGIEENVPPLLAAAGKKIASPFVSAWDSIRNAFKKHTGKDPVVQSDDEASKDAAAEDGVSDAVRGRAAGQTPTPGIRGVLEGDLNDAAKGDARGDK